MQRSNPHSNFFSSLKQVEKRLKLDNPQRENSSTPIESLSSPLYINSEDPNTASSAFLDSEPPRQFLSNSFDFPQTEENPPPKEPQTVDLSKENGVDEIETLLRLLGFSGCGEEERDRVYLGFQNSGDDCGFYGKVVGVKGPKCRKEVERMDGWIKHFLSDGEEERREPLRLAHLLLGNAAFVSQDGDGFEILGFPSTIDEFLQNDPP